MNTKIKLSIVSILALIGLFVGAGTGLAASAVSTTSPIVGCDKATIYGYVTPNGNTTYAWFEWGTSSALGRSTPKQTFNSNSEFSATITGLNENTTYYYRAMAQNQYGTATGQTKSFTTLTCQVQTYTVSTNAGMGGTVSPSSRTVNSGETAIFTVTPNSGYSIGSVTGCNGYLSGNTYTTGSITSNCTIYANFSANPPQTCQDPSAINYGGSLPCRYQNRPTVTLTADNTNVTYNDSTYLRWNSEYATSCIGSGGTSGWSSSKNLDGSFYTGNLTSSKTYTITCSNSAGSANDSVTVYVDRILQPTVNLTATPSSIQKGGSSILSWTSTNTSSCSASWTTSHSTSGYKTVYPTSTTTYSITCEGIGGNASDIAVVSVTNPPLTINISANPSSVPYNGTSTITWYSSYAESCYGSEGVSGWSSSKNTNGSFYTGNLKSTTNFLITCFSSNGGSKTASTRVTVEGQPPVDPSGNLNINPQSCKINPNQSTCTVNATWNTENTTSPALVDRNTGNVLSTLANSPYSYAVWVAYPQTVFDLKNGNQVLDTETAYASCASGTSWNGIICASNIQIQNPTVSLSADNTNLNYNGSTYIRWTSQNATSCSASGGSNGWSGSKSLDGSFYTGSLTYTVTYYITCSNSVGSTNDSVTIYVNDDDNNRYNYNDEPDVNTRSATDIEDTEAMLNGRVDGNGLSTRAWFEYGTDRDLDDSTSERSYSSGTTNYSARITGLEEDTVYYFRAVARNSEGTAYGSTYSFRTDDDNINDNDDDDDPDITTRNATYVGTGNATLNGRVDGNGRSTRAWFEYGTNTNLGYSTSRTSYGNRTTNYSKTITRLLPNTVYYFRAVAENSRDRVYGDILSFSTIGGNIVPAVSNQPTVVIYADQKNIPFNGATFVRWGTVNATSCFASAGSIGWAGVKSIGPGSFYTGSLTESRTYTITCNNNVGSSTDSVTVNVRPQTIAPSRPAPTSLVLVTSSVDRNQPIVPTIDNTKPKPGDEINYTVSYQNAGTGSITNLVLRMDLPYEVDYMFSNPNNPTKSGNTLIFNLGTLRANGQDTVTARVRVRNDIPEGISLDFPAVLSYTDPSGLTQTATANVSAEVWGESETGEKETVQLGALAFLFGDNFLPNSLIGWLLLILLIVLLVLAVRKAYYRSFKTVMIPNNSSTHNGFNTTDMNGGNNNSH